MIRSLSVIAAGAVASTGALAHHGFGSFDLNQDIEITGVFTRVDFVNPHSWLYLDVVQEDGSVTAYRCEMRAATVLRRSGWAPEMFTEGEEITVTGSPDRNDPHSCYVGTVVFADGSSIDRYGQRTAARPPTPVERPLRLASGEPNISGDWAPEQLVMTDPRGQSGALVPLSQAQQFEPGEVPGGGAPMRGSRGGPADPRSADDVEDAPAPPPPPRGPRVEPTEIGSRAAEGFEMWSADNPRMRCETTSILFDWTFDGPINRITQAGDTITLEYGQLGFTRIIHMNVDEHPQNIAPSRGGHSIGRWEDDVLVVDTVRFEPGLLNPPIFHGEQLHVVERFALDPERMALTREYVAEDPEYFVGQYTGSDTIFPADLPFSPDACEELTFVNFAEQQQQRPEQQPDAQAEAPEERRPWWRFSN
jgi:hypothetical protein